MAQNDLALMAATEMVAGFKEKSLSPVEVTRAAAFHFMAVGQLFLTYPSRHTWMRPDTNMYLHAAVLGGIGIQFLASSLPFVANLLGNAAIPLELWAVVFTAAFVSWGLAEVTSRLVWRSACP